MHLAHAEVAMLVASVEPAFWYTVNTLARKPYWMLLEETRSWKRPESTETQGKPDESIHVKIVDGEVRLTAGRG